MNKDFDIYYVYMLVVWSALVYGFEFSEFSPFNPQEVDRSIDVCRCLTEPGNSKYMQENGDACRDAISKEIGVDNWEKVNFSKSAELSARFDALERKCL